MFLADNIQPCISVAAVLLCCSEGVIERGQRQVDEMQQESKTKKEKRHRDGGDSGVNMSVVDLGHSLRPVFYRASQQL